VAEPAALGRDARPRGRDREPGDADPEPQRRPHVAGRQPRRLPAVSPPRPALRRRPAVLPPAQRRRGHRLRAADHEAAPQRRYRVRPHPRRAGPEAGAALPGRPQAPHPPDLAGPDAPERALPEAARRRGADRRAARQARHPVRLRGHDRDPDPRPRRDGVGDHLPPARADGRQPRRAAPEEAHPVSVTSTPEEAHAPRRRDDTGEIVEEHAPRAAEAPRGWLMERLGLDRLDLWVMGVLVLVAFVFRFFSPLMPDLAPGRLLPITNCVTN